MLFAIELSQEEFNAIFGALRQSQEDAIRDIRIWNRVARTCYGEDVTDAPELKHDIEIFNKRQILLQKLADIGKDIFKSGLSPHRFKLWEELSLKERGLAKSDEDGEDEEKKEEKAGHLIVADIAAWQKKKDK